MATEQEIREAIESPAFSHARQGDRCWRDVVWIYHRDEASPTGVRLAASGDAPVVDPLLRARRNTSALSPSER